MVKASHDLTVFFVLPFLPCFVEPPLQPWHGQQKQGWRKRIPASRTQREGEKIKRSSLRRKKPSPPQSHPMTQLSISVLDCFSLRKKITHSKWPCFGTLLWGVDEISIAGVRSQSGNRVGDQG